MEQAVEQPSLAYSEPPSVQEAWEMVTGQLRAEVRRGDYDSYVAVLQPLSFKEGVYRVGAINAYARDWVESRLTSRISKLLTITYGQPVTLRLALINGAERLADAAQSEKAPASVPGQTNGNGAVLNDRAATTKSNGHAPNGGSNGTASTGIPTITRTNGATLSDTLMGETVRGEASVRGETGVRGEAGGRKKKHSESEPELIEEGSSRKIQLQRAYGTERASVIQPERSLFITLYLFNHWLPLIGHSAFTVILAARSLCYWNVRTGELRNTIETDMSELARRASVSVRTVKDVLNQDLIKQYFLRYKVRRVMTSNGVRTAGIILQVRMDDPLTPEDQAEHQLAEETRWYTIDFEDEEE